MTTQPTANEQLDEILDNLWNEAINIGSGSDWNRNKITEAKAKLQRLMVEARLKAQLGMIEYYDQAPTNESCNWKGLLSDNRKQIEYELSQLTKELEK